MNLEVIAVAEGGASDSLPPAAGHPADLPDPVGSRVEEAARPPEAVSYVPMNWIR